MRMTWNGRTIAWSSVVVPQVVRLARNQDSALYSRLMGFPDDLPDLAKKRPPGGNSRPEGIRESCYARRTRNELDSPTLASGPDPTSLVAIIPKFGWICRSMKRDLGFGRLAGIYFT